MWTCALCGVVGEYRTRDSSKCADFPRLWDHWRHISETAYNEGRASLPPTPTNGTPLSAPGEHASSLDRGERILIAMPRDISAQHPKAGRSSAGHAQGSCAGEPAFRCCRCAMNTGWRLFAQKSCWQCKQRLSWEVVASGLSWQKSQNKPTQVCAAGLLRARVRPPFPTMLRPEHMLCGAGPGAEQCRAG